MCFAGESYVCVFVISAITSKWRRHRGKFKLEFVLLQRKIKTVGPSTGQIRTVVKKKTSGGQIHHDGSESELDGFAFGPTGRVFGLDLGI